MRLPSSALALLLLAPLACGPAGGDAADAPASESAAAPRRPHVLLFTLESLRPDHVGFHAGTRDTTPILDALAAEGVVYTDVEAVTSWTLTSHASLFTGLAPEAHGAVTPLARLGPSHTTLAETLAAAGWETIGLASGPYLRRQHGLAQGFARYDDSIAAESSALAHGAVTSERMSDGARAYLRERADPSAPVFLFGYFWDPHYDYVPPPNYAAKFVEKRMQRVPMRHYERSELVHAEMDPAALDYVLSQYDGEIRWTDWHVGRVFAELRAQGLWDDTLVIVTSDHGEEFFEHGTKGHKNNLYRESVHVPMVVKYPKGTPGAPPPGARDDRKASLVDVLPTILEVAGLEHDARVQGRSLLEAAPDPERPVFGALDSIWYDFRPNEAPTVSRRESWVSVRRGDLRLVGVPGDERWELYDLASDPGETEDLAAARPQALAELRALLDKHQALGARLAELHETADADLDEDTLRGLAELGYLK